MGTMGEKVRILGGVALLAATLLAGRTAQAQALKQRDPSAAANAATALNAFLGGVTGQINGGENFGRNLATDGTMQWHDANTVEMLLDYTDATGDTTYLNNIVGSYDGYDPMDPYQVLGQSVGNGANDDLLWWALTFIHAYKDTGNNWYLEEAESVFSTVCGYWGSQGCGGGIPQMQSGTNSDYLNAIVNQLFLETAAQLALVEPNYSLVCSSPAGTGYANTYEGWAWAEYDWFSAHYLYPGATLPIPDGLRPSQGCTANGTQWTYNQGPVIAGLLDLATIAARESAPHVAVDTLLQNGVDIADSAMQTLSQNGVLSELEDFNGGSACTNDSADNCPTFKGAFIRYLSYFTYGVGQLQQPGGALEPLIRPFLLQSVPYLENNANAIWVNSASPGMLTGNWNATQTYGSYPSQATQTSGLDGLIAAIWTPMIIADPTVVPPPTTVTGISETTGHTGDMVTITGTGFSATGVTTFTFGATSVEPLYGCGSTTTCTVPVPAGAGTVGVYSTVAGGAGTTTVEFTYLPPAVTSVSPSVGSSVGGTFVTIDGVGLTSGMTVYFGDVPVIAECGGSLSCSVVTPPYPATGVANVTVVIDGLRSATSAADQFTFLYEPAATSVGSTASTWWTGETVTGTITLNEEAPSGGTQVALSVTSNTAQAAGVTVPAAVTVPAGATSVQFPITIGAVASASVSIAATTTGGSSATSWSIYTGDIAVVQGTAFGVPSSSTTDLTVLLRDPPGASGGTLSVTSSGTAITVPSSPMSVAAGAGSLSVPIVSRSVTAATPVTVTLGYEGNTEVLQVTVEPPLKPLPPPPPPHCVGLCQ